MCDTDAKCGKWESDLYETTQKQIFLNCVVSSSSPVSSSSSTSGFDEEVSISTIIDYLYKHLNDSNQKIEILEDLRKSLVKVSPNGRINWNLFKQGSRLWISNLHRHQSQDGNNNNQVDDDNLAKDSNSSSEERKEDQDENDSPRDRLSPRDSCPPFVNVVNVSSYSPDSNSTRRLTDTTVDSEIEMGYNIDAAIDLRLRIRQFDEENASLREEVLRVEDLNSNLQQRINSLNRRLEQMSVQCRNLQRENDEQKDLLSDAEQQEKSSKLALHKALKEKVLSEKKLASIQSHDESITNLKSQLAKALQENKKLSKKNDEVNKAFEEKNYECDSLKQTILELENTNEKLQQTYESTIQYLREKNKELTNQILELQARSNSSGSDRLSVTPPTGYIHSYMHSTPYAVPKISPRKSLYAELKASGFSPERTKNDSKIAELEEELSWCNEEINTVAQQIESVIQRLSGVGQKPYVPHLNLQYQNSKMPNLALLKQEMDVLMNMVTERVWKGETKDFSLQVAIGSPKIHHQFSSSLENNSAALSESSMTSRSIEVVRETAKNNECPPEAAISKIQNKSVQVQENSIFDPVVQALDQIIQGSIDDDSNLQRRFSARNQKRRCIYTHTRPPTPNPDVIITPSQNSLNSNQDKTEESHCISARGDAPEITPKKNFTPENSQFSTTDSKLSRPDTMRPLEISINSPTPEKKREISTATYCVTPNSSFRAVPRRKLSVFHRSFDIESLQPREENSREKRRSVSTPDQEEDHEMKENETLSRTPLLNSYRSVLNSTDSSADSFSPPKTSCEDDEVFDEDAKKQVRRPLILAKSKLVLPEKLEEREVKKFDETRIISKDSQSLEVETGIKKDTKVFNNVTLRKKIGSASSTASDFSEREATHSGKEGYSKPSGDATFNKFSKELSSVSPLLFDSVDRIDETIYSGDSSLDITCEEIDSKITSFGEKILGVPVSRAEICSANGNNSGSVVTGNEKASKIAPVISAMSSGEDSSDSECDRINSQNDRQVATNFPASLIKSPPLNSKLKILGEDKKLENGEEPETWIREKIQTHRRSLSASESTGCRCKNNEVILATPLQALDKDEIYSRAFPSLSDDRLQESGIANFSDLQSEFSENLSEEDLERKYTALSVGLRADRMTLSRRMTLSQRQRDQAERNMRTEVEKMQQDIQDLAPLCTDKESLERVERVNRQLEMIAQCSHRVSCVAETLGAVHQERRVSRAALLADRYLQLLRTRCEKLLAEVNETKRILMENNIMIEEHPSELGDDIPRIRYRAVPTNNRTMMARRRASIAAISRPLGSQQDLKEGPRQRNSVSGRVTFRRPSLSHETQKWENEKLVRTDSSSSIGEIREAEPRRNSREENNNNVVRSPANYVISSNCETIEDETWLHPGENFAEESSHLEKMPNEMSQLRKSNWWILWTAVKYVLLHPVFWYILISFFFGFYVKDALSSKLCVGAPHKWHSLQEFFEQYIHVKNTAPRPI
ncbi:lymphoid-restricted membrane protein-like isoform X2 [Belonocnema kinseyi]|uniref:lymphoid-restricted membrane protein-like isoform X2 n=1 Tax=Belonocnema kinseyi TaxID=2817044 RepID=UPI00143D2872|nr:lymphoid-restricted membrane protein-like isoform X2 [Belonocnema kinseyi]